MRIFIPLLLLAQMIVFSSSSQTWTGAASTDWNNAGNWTSPASVPAAGSNVTLPGTVASNRWPVLSSDVTINSINAAAGFQLNVNGFKLNIITGAAYNTIIGGIINNTNAATDIVININTGGGGYDTRVQGTTFTDHVFFNLSGNNTFYQDYAGSGNVFNGNATYDVSSNMAVFISHNFAAKYGGNLSLNRSAGGYTQFFNAGVTVAGNFSYTNNTTGETYIGNSGIKSAIGGTVSVAANYSAPNIFQVYRLINQTTGGSINVQNTRAFDFRLDTLKVSALSITGYQGGAFATFFNNAITGPVTLADDASYSGGYNTMLRNNVFTGSFICTIKGSNPLFEADLDGSLNVYNGNAVFNAQGSGAIYLSHGAASVHNGNLSITRTASGHTQAFNAGGNVTGNFSYTNQVNGNAYFGNAASRTQINGTLTLLVKNSSPGDFKIYHLINKTGGGSISFDSTNAFDFRNDTLLLNTLTGQRYYGGAYAYMLNNSITANTTISDDISYSGGYDLHITNNVFTGNTSFTHKGSNTIYEADAAGTGNIYNGNASFAGQGSGALFVSHGAASQFNGDLTITRTANGQTQAFNAGGNVTGNFSYTNLINGNTYFGNTDYKTLINGTVTILVKNGSPGDFRLYRLINKLGGGTISLDSTKAPDFRKDTLLLSTLTSQRYYGGAYGYFLNNNINAAITTSDDASYSGGYYLQIRNNIFTGNCSFTHKGSNNIYEADDANTGNIFNGNTSFTGQGSGAFFISHASLSKFNGNLAITRTGGGNVTAFNAGATVTGNFSFASNVSGNTVFGNQAAGTLINGTLNIQAKNTGPGDIKVYRLINKTNGGSISLDSTKPLDFRNDTLLLTNLTARRYYGGAYGYLLNNQITATTTIADDVSYNGGYYLQIRNNVFNGNSSFTHNGSNNIYEADDANTGNIFNGNTSFAGQGTGYLFISHADPSQFKGNLTISRTGNGQTQAFNAGGTVTGNFLYTNLVNGNSYFGNPASRTLITGTVNIQVKNANPYDFKMYRVINQTNGGNISLDSTKPFTIQNDTLLLTNFSALHYYGGSYGYLLNNFITANTTIADDISYGGGYYLQIQKNVFTGNSSFTHKGGNNIWEADAANTGNIYNGNTSFTLQGNGSLYASHADGSKFNGDLTVTRNTTSSVTQIFNTSGTVSGNLIFNNNIGGPTLIGNITSSTLVNGQVSIAVKHSGPSDMVLKGIKNLTPGGSVNIQNTKPVDLQKDTLIVSPFSVTGMQGGAYGYIFNNKITGDASFADDPTYGGGYNITLRGNVFTGNTNITNNGSNSLISSDADALGNKFIGNAAFTKKGTGILYIGSAFTDEVTQNFTVTAASGVSINYLRFAGSTNSVIAQGGVLPITIYSLFVNKTGVGNITLNNSVQISGTAAFTRGIINGSAGKELIFFNGTTHSGASDSSHVAGPVSKFGNQAFVFPVGNGQGIQTAAISAPANTTDQFRTQYFASSPHPTYDTSKHAAALNNVSGAQYWIIDRLAGTSNVFVTLEYGKPRGVAITGSQANYRVTRWTGTTWENLGNGGTTGTLLEGTVQTAAVVPGFSPFTIAATSGIDPLNDEPGVLPQSCANNPLAVSFKSSGVFNAGNVFTAQLSNASGSFASPVNIGSINLAPNGLNVSNTINAYVPSSAVATGTGYRIRVVSSNPVQNGSVSSSNIAINSLYIGPDTSIALSCQGSTVNLTTIYNTTGLTTNWNTANPAAAPSGNYRLAVANNLGCKDTALAAVQLKVSTWTGAVSNDWHNPANWNNNKVPDENTHVIVATNTPNACVISTADAKAASIQVRSGAVVNTINNRKVLIAGKCATLPPQ
jgi:hypothetical protein